MSNQNWRTPENFLKSINNRFGNISFDLCASDGDEVVSAHYNPQQDSLKQDWALLDGNSHSVVWLNPPFANINPWAKKLITECKFLKRWTLMLVPASVGTEWYKIIHNNAFVLFLSPRMKFIGADDPYPKDLMLVCVGFGCVGVDIWRWDTVI